MPKERSFRRLAVVLIALILVLGGGGYAYRVLTKVEPEVLVQETLKKSTEAGSYRYSFAAEFNIAGRQQMWSRVRGEMAEDRVHIKGKILGTPVEMYRIGPKTFTLDPVSNNWIILEGTDVDRQHIFMAEIEPFSNFHFKSVQNPKLIGVEKVGEKKCWVIEFSPQVENRYLEMWWQNFVYRFWIDRKTHTLIKAKATAENKNSPGTFLSLVVEFRDYNKKIKIDAPL